MTDQQIFAHRLRDGDTLVGTLVSLASAEVCEMLAHVGYDWLFIDAEHGAFNPQQTQGMLQAAAPTPCVIRVPEGEAIWIKKALDIGAAGVIVPQVHTAEQAREIIRHCKYPPDGDRGVGGARAHKYGLEFEQQLKHANTDTAVILQAESRQAIDNIEEIVKLDGLDAILIGPYDLSASLGHTGEITHPEVQLAIDKVISACQSAGVQIGYFGVSADAVLPYKEKGVTLLIAGVDTGFFLKSATENLAEMHG